MLPRIDTEDFADTAAIEEEVATTAAAMAIRAELSKPGSVNCQGCKKEIPKERREFLPSARFCALCQQDFDAGRRFILGATIKDIEENGEDDELTAEEAEFAVKIIKAQNDII